MKMSVLVINCFGYLDALIFYDKDGLLEPEYKSLTKQTFKQNKESIRSNYHAILIFIDKKEQFDDADEAVKKYM